MKVVINYDQDRIQQIWKTQFVYNLHIFYVLFMTKNV